MHIRARRTYFALLMLLFTLSAPLLIYYSRGWRIDTAQRRIVLTGSLSITTEPSGVAVKINGETVGTTPLRAYRLAPDQYLLTIEHKEYITREQEITIEASRALVLLDMAIYPEVSSPTPLLTAPTRSLIVSSDASSFALVGSDEQGQDAVLVEAHGENRFATVATFPAGTVQDIVFSPSAETLGIVSEEKDVRAFWAVDIPSRAIVDVTPRTHKDAKTMLWDKDKLFFETETAVLGQEENTLVEFTQPPKDVALWDNQAYILSQTENGTSGKLLRQRLEPGSSPETVAEDLPVTAQMNIFFHDPDIVLHDAQRGQFVLLPNATKSVRGMYSTSDVNTHDANDERGEYLLANPHEISLFTQGKQRETILRSVREILSPKWIERKNSLIFLSEGYLVTADLRFSPPVTSRLSATSAQRLEADPINRYVTLVGEDEILRYPLE